MGHYNLPRFSTQKLLGVNKDITFLKDQTTQTESGVCLDENEKSSESERLKELGYEEFLRKESLPAESKWIMEKYTGVKIWINQQENKGLKLSLIIMTGCVIAMFWYLQIQVR